MGDAQLMLSGNLQVVHLQQIMVLQQAAGDGIFNGHHPNQLRVFIRLDKNIAKGITCHNLQRFTPEIIARRNLMIGTQTALYSNPLHLFPFYPKKNPIV